MDQLRLTVNGAALEPAPSIPAESTVSLTTASSGKILHVEITEPLKLGGKRTNSKYRFKNGGWALDHSVFKYPIKSKEVNTKSKLKRWAWFAGSLLVTLFHFFLTSPLLWSHQSSAAFNWNLGLWAGLLFANCLTGYLVWLQHDGISNRQKEIRYE